MRPSAGASGPNSLTMRRRRKLWRIQPQPLEKKEGKDCLCQCDCVLLVYLLCPYAVHCAVLIIFMDRFYSCYRIQTECVWCAAVELMSEGEDGLVDRCLGGSVTSTVPAWSSVSSVPGYSPGWRQIWRTEQRNTEDCTAELRPDAAVCAQLRGGEQTHDGSVGLELQYSTEGCTSHPTVFGSYLCIMSCTYFWFCK